MVRVCKVHDPVDRQWLDDLNRRVEHGLQNDYDLHCAQHDDGGHMAIIVDLDDVIHETELRRESE